MITKIVPFPYIDNPKLYDRVVQNIRRYLDNNIDWTCWSFHIARPGVTDEGETYPQIYSQEGGKEHHDLRPDNQPSAYFFFEIGDPAMILNDEEEGTDYNISVIFYGRLDKIKSSTHDYTSEIIAEFIYHLKSLNAREITIDTEPAIIWDKYTEIIESYDQMFMKHGTTFRINFLMKDFEDCYEEMTT